MKTIKTFLGIDILIIVILTRGIFINSKIEFLEKNLADYVQKIEDCPTSEPSGVEQPNTTEANSTE
jgi:hypothetical protein